MKGSIAVQWIPATVGKVFLIGNSLTGIVDLTRLDVPPGNNGGNLVKTSSPLVTSLRAVSIRLRYQ